MTTFGSASLNQSNIQIIKCILTIISRYDRVHKDVRMCGAQPDRHPGAWCGAGEYRTAEDTGAYGKARSLQYSGGDMRSEKIAFDVPEDVLAALRMGVKGLEHDMKRFLVLHYFKKKRLSIGQGSEIGWNEQI